jgi:hypothetical protein
MFDLSPERGFFYPPWINTWYVWGNEKKDSFRKDE